MDELAHTNAEGCRHLKRYQDVEELLNNGIDVYTTVNVQHIESLNDIVASITGVLVRERIPDHVFDRADQVSLVDIEPEELIANARMRVKFIKREPGAKALGNFTTENLVALREKRFEEQLTALTGYRIKSSSHRAAITIRMSTLWCVCPRRLRMPG